MMGLNISPIIRITCLVTILSLFQVAYGGKTQNSRQADDDKARQQQHMDDNIRTLIEKSRENEKSCEPGKYWSDNLKECKDCERDCPGASDLRLCGIECRQYTDNIANQKHIEELSNQLANSQFANQQQMRFLQELNNQSANYQFAHQQQIKELNNRLTNYQFAHQQQIKEFNNQFANDHFWRAIIGTGVVILLLIISIAIFLSIIWCCCIRRNRTKPTPATADNEAEMRMQDNRADNIQQAQFQNVGWWPRMQRQIRI